jgi:hypothetical protein
MYAMAGIGKMTVEEFQQTGTGGKAKIGPFDVEDVVGVGLIGLAAFGGYRLTQKPAVAIGAGLAVVVGLAARDFFRLG